MMMNLARLQYDSPLWEQDPTNKVVGLRRHCFLVDLILEPYLVASPQEEAEVEPRAFPAVE